MYLNQKDLKKVMTVANLAGRINELEKIEPYVPSGAVLKRKSDLKKQLREVLGKKEDKEEQVLNIKIELPDSIEEKKREKS
jgi:hypothetical protein